MRTPCSANLSPNLIQRRLGWRSGYKAALTAVPAQQAMGINEPIGVVFEHAAYQADSATTVATDRLVLLETEAGFTLRKEITAPVAKDDVFDAIACCSGMIELASPNLQQRPTGADLIANNAASYGCISGASAAYPTTLILTPYGLSHLYRRRAASASYRHGG